MDYTPTHTHTHTLTHTPTTTTFTGNKGFWKSWISYFHFPHHRKDSWKHWFRAEEQNDRMINQEIKSLAVSSVSHRILRAPVTLTATVAVQRTEWKTQKFSSGTKMRNVFLSLKKNNKGDHSKGKRKTLLMRFLVHKKVKTIFASFFRWYRLHSMTWKSFENKRGKCYLPFCFYLIMSFLGQSIKEMPCPVTCLSKEGFRNWMSTDHALNSS